MKRIILGGLVGAVILFVWGIVAWLVLPLHDASLRRIADEDKVITALRSSMDVEGIYVFPAMPEKTPAMAAQEREAAMTSWTEKYKRGPIGMIIYRPRGANPLMPGERVSGFVLNFLSALLAGWFLSRSTAAVSSYTARVAFCGMLGLFASLVTHLSYWNWMGFPQDYTTAMVLDVLVGWVLAGLGIGAIVKVPQLKAV